MRKQIPALLALAVWSGCTLDQHDPAAGNFSDEANLSALEFATAQSVAVAGIKGMTKAANAFHGYRRVTEWRTPAAAATTEIAALMAGVVHADLAMERPPLQPDEAVVRLHSFCFNPGYAVRPQSDRGRRDFLVCLECDEMYVLDDAGHSWQHHLDKAEAGRLATLLGGA